jgi:hypothetical protein
MGDGTEFRVFTLGDVARVEAGPEVEDPEATAEVFLQFDADTAERVGRQLMAAAAEARNGSDGPRPANNFGGAVE